MIDQRVSEGILSNFFNQKALTTTIPAQLIKKFKIMAISQYKKLRIMLLARLNLGLAS